MQERARQPDYEPIDVTTMPSTAVMTQRLQGLGLWGRNPIGDRVLANFMDSVADQETCGPDLVAAWERGCQAALKGFPVGVDLTVAHVLHAYLFPQIIEVVTPDQRVADDAKKGLKFLEEIRDGVSLRIVDTESPSFADHPEAVSKTK